MFGGRSTERQVADLGPAHVREAVGDDEDPVDAPFREDGEPLLLGRRSSKVGVDRERDVAIVNKRRLIVPCRESSANTRPP